jgi:hypothetical protein
MIKANNQASCSWHMFGALNNLNLNFVSNFDIRIWYFLIGIVQFFSDNQCNHCVAGYSLRKSIYPIYHTGCQIIKGQHFNCQEYPIIPQPSNPNGRDQNASTHDAQANQGIEGIIVSLGNQTGQKEHTNVHDDHQIVEAAQITPKVHMIGVEVALPFLIMCSNHIWSPFILDDDD